MRGLSAARRRTDAGQERGRISTLGTGRKAPVKGKGRGHEVPMKRNVLLSLPLVLTGAVAFAQIALPPGASPQSPQDPGYQALIATCKTPPPPPAARGGGPGRAGGGPAAAAAPATFPPPPAEYNVTAIPGVIAAGQKWTKVWEVDGNNADGILADKNGDLLIAQNHNAAVVKLDKSGKASAGLQGHAHRRRPVDEQEGRSVHGPARPAGRT